eukprot:1587923-Prymnesium_polylepis.2
MASMSTLPSTVSSRSATSGASGGCDSRYSTTAGCVRLRASDMMTSAARRRSASDEERAERSAGRAKLPP